MSCPKGQSATGKIRSNGRSTTSGIETANFRLVALLPQPTTLKSSLFKESIVIHEKIRMMKPTRMRRAQHAEHAERKGIYKIFWSQAVKTFGFGFDFDFGLDNPVPKGYIYGED
jgi:hypothetical protein